jgi:opacity protein-like surface antigen
MKILASYCILVLAAGPLDSQEPKRSAVSVELGIASANFHESFSSDCCGPTQKATGGALSIRIKRPTRRLIAVGAEAGTSVTSRPDMSWLMATGTIARSGRLTPWAQVGAGLVAQQGRCPQDSSDTSSDCATDITLGGVIGAGVRWRLRHNLAIGLETAFVTGTPRSESRFSTVRYGVTLTQ